MEAWFWLGQLSGLGIAVGQVLVDVLLAESIRLAYTDGGKLPRADEPVDSHVRHPQGGSNLGDREEPWPCLVCRGQLHHPSPPARLYAKVASVASGEDGLVPRAAQLEGPCGGSLNRFQEGGSDPMGL